jgi:hypothetical protein
MENFVPIIMRMNFVESEVSLELLEKGKRDKI